MTTAKETVITMGNTKKELLAAYEAMKQSLDEQTKELLNVEAARKKAEKAAALVVAQQETENDPVKRIHDLRAALGKELLKLAELFEEEVNTFKNISTAVTEKQHELKALYGVEATAADLAVLIETQNERKNSFETEISEKRLAFEQEMEQAKEIFNNETTIQREKWQKELADNNTKITELKEIAEKTRKRETEEYEYSLKRKREQQSNKLNDELQLLEKEISTKRNSFETAVAQREEELDKREQVIAAHEQALGELEAKVEAFPAEKASAVEQAVAEKSTQLNAKFTAQQALEKATSEGEKSVLQSRIEALEKLVESQSVQLEQLSKQHENAYQKVQEIANRAVESARREVIAYAPPQSNQGKSLNQE